MTTTGRQERIQKWKHKLCGWYETDFGPSRIMPMEGLRGLAIALVFLCHFQIVILSPLSESFHSRFFLVMAQIGGTGVDLFFVLSGMLIYRAALKPGMKYGKFLLRRVERIFPTFVAVLALYIPGAPVHAFWRTLSRCRLLGAVSLYRGKLVLAPRHHQSSRNHFRGMVIEL